MRFQQGLGDEPKEAGSEEYLFGMWREQCESFASSIFPSDRISNQDSFSVFSWTIIERKIYDDWRKSLMEEDISTEIAMNYLVRERKGF